MTETPEKKFTGFAKGTGKLVHIIVDDVFALCDRKREMLPEEKLKITDVGCAKCKQSAMFKSMAEEAKIPIEHKKPKAKKQQPKKAAAQKSKPKTKTDVKKEVVQKKQTERKDKDILNVTQTPIEKPETQSETSSITSETPMSTSEEEKQTVQIETIEEMIKRLKQKISKKENVFDVLSGPFTCEKRTNGLFKIIHKQSKIPYFDNVSKEVIPFAMLFLNNIDEDLYNTIGISPKDYITLARNMFSIASIEAGTFYPKQIKPKTPAEKDQPQKLRRRKKKPVKKDKIQKLRRRKKKK